MQKQRIQALEKAHEIVGMGYVQRSREINEEVEELKEANETEQLFEADS
jgi:hypothetical protein